VAAIGGTSLLETFRTLDPAIKDSLADIDKPMLLALATLTLAEDLAGRPYLSSEHIVAALEAAGIALNHSQVSNALSRAGNKVSRKTENEERYYRAMIPGRRLVEPILSIGPIHLTRVEAGKPRSARRHLAELLGSLSGTVRICDPWYGLRTLDALAMLPLKCTVRFLTSQTNEKRTSLAGPIADFKREHPNVEMRATSLPSPLHDRYVLTSDELLLLGQGIKDVGNKESFIVGISSSFAADLLKETEASFDSTWSRATAL
jgi:hypothetical protein